MKKDIIEKGMLARKIKEHFSKNPKSSSVIIKNKSSDGKKFWRVTREGKDFKIIEVKTEKASYLLEMNMTEASTAQQAVTQMAQAIASATPQMLGTPEGQKTLLYKFNQLSPSMDAASRKAIQDLLTSMGISTAAHNAADSGQFGQLGGMAKAANASLSGKALNTSKTLKGKVLKEDNPLKKKDPSSIEPEEPDDETGLESSSGEQESDPETEDDLLGNKSEEETLFLETLKGQTIKTADLKLDVNGGILTLQLVSVLAPLELEWHNNGKVLYRHKNRPYLLKK